MKRDLPKDRPPPLKINRPGSIPPHHHHLQQPPHPGGPPLPYRSGNPNFRPPVIIHTYSPEVIETDSDNFRHLVQRLTGPAGQASPLGPPPKRARVGLPPLQTTGITVNPNYQSYAHSNSFNRARLGLPPTLPAPPAAVPSPRDFLVPHRPAAFAEPPIAWAGHENLPHNPLLSPSVFDFSPSLLPSPSAFAIFDFPSPMGLHTSTGSASLPWPMALGSLSSIPAGPHSLLAGFPSPGPLSVGFLADLPVLSPAALPPRPPPSVTANLFPSPLQEDEIKPIRLHRDRR